MNKSVELFKIQGELGKKELRFHALDAKSDRTADETKEYEKIDGEIREFRERELVGIVAAREEIEAAIIERTENTPENRERRKLRAGDGVSVGKAIGQRLGGTDAFTGALGEYISSCGVKPSEFPLDYWTEEREHRALTAAPTKASQTLQGETMTQPTVVYRFAPQSATALGVELRPAAPGASHHVVVTTPVPGSAKAKGAALTNTAAVLTLSARTPKRLGAQFEVAVEDEALYGSLGTDLDREASNAVDNVLDVNIINGGGGAELDGLFGVATDVSAEGTKATFPSGLALFAALVDSRFATGWQDIRAIVGSDTFSLFASLMASGSDTSLYDYLAARLGSGLMVSARVPAKNAMAQKVLAVRTANAPITVDIWGNSMGIRIDDPYSAAGSGKRIVTLSLLVGSPFVPHGTDQVLELHPKIA